MDTARLEQLRSDARRALSDANASMTISLRSWLRDLPELAAAAPDDDVADWIGTLECVSDGIERLISGGTSIASARSYLLAYDLCAEAHRLLTEPAKASCPADCVSGCSLCGGCGVVFEERSAA